MIAHTCLQSPCPICTGQKNTDDPAILDALVDVADAAERARADARKGPGPFADAMSLMCRALDRLEEVRHDCR